MLKEITLPEIAENVESGIVVEVLVSEGDTIEAEQPLVELETDKATFEVPSTDAGIIKEIKVAAGDEVKVGEIIVTIETNGEGKEPEKDETTVKEEKPKKAERGDDKKEVKEEKEQDLPEEKKDTSKEDVEHQEKQQEGEADEQDDKKQVHKEDIPAAPSVRRLAREMGVDLSEIKGSGPGGRISKEDVEKHEKDGVGEEIPEKETRKKVDTGELPDFSKWGIIEKQPLSNIRRITAETMQNAWQSIPHVTQFDQANISAVESFMEKYAAKVEKEGGKLTITAVLLKLCATALQSYPKFNASVDMQNHELIYKKYFHIGIAVDTPQGLLVPVIRDVDKKSVFTLSAEVTEMAKKARDKKISPDDLQGGNFTISNLGGIGGTNFTPIVYPPQVAILGVARASKQPIYQEDDERPSFQNILPLSLSYDHRAIDGAEGARFLRWICNALEDPFLALMEGGR